MSAPEKLSEDLKYLLNKPASTLGLPARVRSAITAWASPLAPGEGDTAAEAAYKDWFGDVVEGWHPSIRVGDIVSRYVAEWERTWDIGPTAILHPKEAVEALGLRLGMHIEGWSHVRPYDNKPSVTIRFNVDEPGVMDAVFEAQNALAKVGIRFDTGTDLCVPEGESRWREWQMDWSLMGPVQVRAAGEVVWDGAENKRERE